MIFHFPNLDTLRLAMTSGEVPAEVSGGPVRASFADDGSLHVEPETAVPRAMPKALKRLGVAVVRSHSDGVAVECLCWAQLFPLVREPGPVPAGQTPVLFELPEAGRLPILVSEMLRLGNDRQSFRYLADEAEQSAVLLRVIGPPYYSLLQALDREDSTAPRVYLERAAHIWVEIGYTHPLLEMMRPPTGQLLLLRAPRDWCLLVDAPFRDIYEILDFPLAAAPLYWQDRPAQQRLQVPLRLTAGGIADPEELWVLRDNPLAQLEAFVREASDQLLARLSFAVAEDGDRQTVVLRVRPARQPPPVLTLEAQAFRPYLKLPNLFVPRGRLLQPQLRRDAVRRLLAHDPDQITWLWPQADGTFTPESLPDSAFRPLSDWVDYVFSRERVGLQGWIDATLFEFERFICNDEPRPRDREPKEKAPREVRPRSQKPAAEPAPEMALRAAPQPRPAAGDDEELDPLATLPARTPTELQQRQQALEKQFLNLDGPIDAPERQALWPELAAVYAAQNNLSDATICWSNALWEDSDDHARWVRAWYRVALQEQGEQPLDQQLRRILTSKKPAPADGRLVAAAVMHAAQQESPEAAVVQLLGPLQHFLQQHETLLPVRVVWLAALSFCQLAHGDVLALARTRDRLLERLFRQGLTVDLDLPSFLRFTGDKLSDRFRAFRDWLQALPTRVQHWLNKVTRKIEAQEGHSTLAYAQLMLAFGFARLGDAEQSRQLHEAAWDHLSEQEQVHKCLLAAFDYRIDQALQGQPASGPLPADQIDRLQQLEREPRYVVDRLRQHSRILEPHEKIDPYRAWRGRYGDELSQSLALLPDLHDSAQLQSAVADLFEKHGRRGAVAKRNHARILIAALELGPRIGQTFALPLLNEVSAALLHLTEMFEKANLLEKALFAAAHFDQPQYVHALVDHFQQLLASRQGQLDLRDLDTLAGQSFRGLRKLGLHEAIHRLLSQLSDALLQGETMAARRADRQWPKILSSLLTVAAGWYYFGGNEQAQPILEEARLLLYKGELSHQEKTRLACAYVTTLGQAPVDVALHGIEEMFTRLQGVHDNFMTSLYYSLSQLDVIEAVVLAIVTEDFALGSQARRWLDEDEYLVRRRIHQDLQRIMQQTE